MATDFPDKYRFYFQYNYSVNTLRQISSDTCINAVFNTYVETYGCFVNMSNVNEYNANYHSRLNDILMHVLPKPCAIGHFFFFLNIYLHQ